MTGAEPTVVTAGGLVGPPGPGAPLAIVSTLPSDAHTWNLVFLQLLIEEHGFRVLNLGPAVPLGLLVDRCAELRPALVVISSVNGHGHQDGLRAITALRARPENARVPVVIGGKLGVSAVGRTERAQELLAAGFDAVYDDTGGTEDFLTLIASLSDGPAETALPAGSAASATGAVLTDAAGPTRHAVSAVPAVSAGPGIPVVPA
ncbi:cobalamin B12-binding domain-containing protein [Streptomyces sp. NPDC002690]